MKRHFFITLLIAVLGTHALDYRDLKIMSASCPLKDRCENIGDRSFSGRNCECDSLCSLYQDCCIDASVSMATKQLQISGMNCMAYSNNPESGAYVIATCPTKYFGPSVVRRKCQGNDDLRDPLYSVPVTDVPTGVTFRNRYCAECNAAAPTSLMSWLIYMDCGHLEDLGVNESYVWKNLNFSQELEKWVVEHEGKLHTCELMFDRPDDLATNVRMCRPNVVSTCPDNWKRKSVRRACESYTAVVYGKESAYRNPHCAVCNGRAAFEISCSRNDAMYRSIRPFFDALVLDVNRSDGDPSGASGRFFCPSGQKYDPYVKKCRTLVCAIPGYKLGSNKCIEQ